MRVPYSRLVEWAEREVRAALRDLPPEIRSAAEEVVIRLERRPEDLGDEAPDSELLGLFLGSPWESDDSIPMPPSVVLFIENLWDYAGGHHSMFLKEVRRTVLHELGHYLHFDEDDLDRLGIG